MIPQNITREHIEKAIQEIDDQGIRKGRQSSTYDLVFNNKLYPPKLVISIANRFANDEELDPNTFAGGEGTEAFELLINLGFEIIAKNNNSSFSWVQTHKEIVGYLLNSEDKQKELIELLKSVGITPFNDKDGSDEHSIELDEIDPFTFFCYIYKYGPQRRLKYLQEIAKKLNISVPNNDKGIPSAPAQKVWLFPYKYGRTNNEVPRLWRFFKKGVENKIENTDFEDVLKINSTGKTKLTEGLFYIDPDSYFPINGPTKPYLKEVLGIDPKFNTYSEYVQILEKIKNKSDKPFYELSYEAWKWNDQKKKVNYWIFQGNPKIFNVVGAINDNALKSWSVKAHKDKIKKGDKFILWMTGENQGCYALGKLTSDVYEGIDDEIELKYYYVDPNPNEKGLMVDVEITHNLTSNPITKDAIIGVKELADLKVGNRGTNFSATEIEYNKILELIENKDNMGTSEIFYITVSNSHQDENGNFLTAKMKLEQNGYKLLKGSYIYKEPKQSFLSHHYYKQRKSYETEGFFSNSSFNDFYILNKDISFKSPSPAAVMVLNRAANGRTEWKLENGTTLAEFENKFDFSEIINDFLEQAKTENLKTKDYPKTYGDLKIKVSFGAGNQAEIPWIALLKEPNKVTEGIYPVYLYFKREQKLILAYGLSETNNPITTWNIENPTTITNYYYKNGLGKPKRYGSSYVYKVYDIDNFPDAAILNDDLDNLLSIYKNQEINTPPPIEIDELLEQEDFKILKFIEDTKESGLLFSNKLVTRFISSLITKPFVLLSGLSGSGKTKLAQTFAKWVCENESQYCVVPVGADWTNREPLLGYENALDSEEYILPENGALKLVIDANRNLNRPHFLILDEMNLSHVERYFADFLSVMESKEKFKLHSNIGQFKSDVPDELSWPKNLFVIGTVNIDETTYMFSPKVLDRANVIEFRVNESELETFLKGPKDINFDNLIGKGGTMALDFITKSNNGTNGTISEPLNETLVEFFKELKKVGAEFGYRTAMEIHRLFHQLEVINPDMDEIQKVDIAIMQKLLPKLHGSRRKLCPVLESLGYLCVNDINVKKEFFENNNDLNFELQHVKYPISLEKITRMYKGAIDNGFASYAEA